MVYIYYICIFTWNTPVQLSSEQHPISVLTHACFYRVINLFPHFFQIYFRYFQKGYYRFEHYIVLFSTFAFVFLVYIVIIQVRTRRSNLYLKVNRFREGEKERRSNLYLKVNRFRDRLFLYVYLQCKVNVRVVCVCVCACACVVLFSL